MGEVGVLSTNGIERVAQSCSFVKASSLGLRGKS